jgi:alpha-L-arabinofuranosidase
MSNESLNDFEYDVEYYEGFYSFRNEQVEVLMDEATFDRYWHAYLLRHGIETRSNCELMEYAAKVDKQHFEAEQVLFKPDYWREIVDPHIRIIQLKSTCHTMPTDTASKREE